MSREERHTSIRFRTSTPLPSKNSSASGYKGESETAHGKAEVLGQIFLWGWDFSFNCSRKKHRRKTGVAPLELYTSLQRRRRSLEGHTPSWLPCLAGKWDGERRDYQCLFFFDFFPPKISEYRTFAIKRDSLTHTKKDSLF